MAFIIVRFLSKRKIILHGATPFTEFYAWCYSRGGRTSITSTETRQHLHYGNFREKKRSAQKEWGMLQGVEDNPEKVKWECTFREIRYRKLKRGGTGRKSPTRSEQAVLSVVPISWRDWGSNH